MWLRRIKEDNRTKLEKIKSEGRVRRVVGSTGFVIITELKNEKLTTDTVVPGLMLVGGFFTTGVGQPMTFDEEKL